MFNWPTYKITRSAHPVKCPPQCPSPIHPHSPLSSPSSNPSSFPRVRSLYDLSPFLIFPKRFFSIPLYSLSVLFIFSKAMRTYTVLLWLTYFTQHNTLQFHSRWSKCWVFVVSNVSVIVYCIHKSHLLYPFIFWWTPRLLPQLAIVDILL